jgi:hypothetical protein
VILRAHHFHLQNSSFFIRERRLCDPFYSRFTLIPGGYTDWHDEFNFPRKSPSQSGYCRTNDGHEGQGNNGFQRDQNKLPPEECNHR